jgi:3-methylfumaryl-CoA hydratase
LATWQQWVGGTEQRTETVHGPDVARLAAAIGWDTDTLGWPPLGHWALFRPVPGPLGTDGHPARGGFMPPVSLPRRMFAGAQTQFHVPLLVDVPATQTRRLAALEAKQGKSGPLLLAQVEISIEQDGVLALNETQTIVYRDAGAPEPLPVPQPPALDVAASFTPGPVDLFLYSAATGNSHRIHYDADYARDVENWPALLVHGPLVAAQLLGLWERRRGPARHFGFRSTAPLFAGQPIHLMDDGNGGLQALRCDGTVAMNATAG